MDPKLRKLKPAPLGNRELASSASITFSGKGVGNLEVDLIGPQFMPNCR
jgi:hypothetical protein